MQQWQYETVTPDGQPIPYMERSRNDVMQLNGAEAAKVLAPFLDSHVSIPGIANGLKCNPGAVEAMLRRCLMGLLSEQVIELAERNDELLAQMLDVWGALGNFECQFPPAHPSPSHVEDGVVVVEASANPARSLVDVLTPLLEELATRRKEAING